MFDSIFDSIFDDFTPVRRSKSKPRKIPREQAVSALKPQKTNIKKRLGKSAQKKIEKIKQNRVKSARKLTHKPEVEPGEEEQQAAPTSSGESRLPAIPPRAVKIRTPVGKLPVRPASRQPEDLLKWASRLLTLGLERDPPVAYTARAMVHWLAAHEEVTPDSKTHLMRQLRDLGVP